MPSSPNRGIPILPVGPVGHYVPIGRDAPRDIDDSCRSSDMQTTTELTLVRRAAIGFMVISPVLFSPISSWGSSPKFSLAVNQKSRESERKRGLVSVLFGPQVEHSSKRRIGPPSDTGATHDDARTYRKSLSGRSAPILLTI